MFRERSRQKSQKECKYSTTDIKVPHEFGAVKMPYIEEIHAAANALTPQSECEQAKEWSENLKLGETFYKTFAALLIWINVWAFCPNTCTLTHTFYTLNDCKQSGNIAATKSMCTLASSVRCKSENLVPALMWNVLEVTFVHRNVCAVARKNQHTPSNS